MDKDGYIQTWNKGAEKNKGYKASEIIGKHFSTFYQQSDRDDKKPEHELAIARKLGRAEDEDWRVRKDGSKFWANVVITALHDSSGELVGFAKVTRNLTDRKEHEDSLRQANRLLQLQQKELQQLNMSKDEFISLASHQLRTPATAIKQLLGLLLEGFQGDIPDSIVSVLQKTYQNNERQIAIINSLLQVAQIDSGKVVLEKSNHDINALITKTTDSLSEIISTRDQTLTTDFGSSRAVSNVDAQYIRMAIENIIDNASKYSFDGSDIHVKTEVEGDRVIIMIRDNGVGMSEGDMLHLFEKFYRIPNDLSHKFSGTGLGLYWVKKVVELHDGTIQVESELGSGTTFYVILPRAK